MKVALTSDPVESIDVQAVVIGIWKDEPLNSAALAVDRASGGRLTELIAAEEISTDFAEVTEVYGINGVKAKLVVTVGLGKREPTSAMRAFRASGAASKRLARKARKSVAFYLDELFSIEAVVGSMLACVGQDLYRKNKSLFPLETIFWHAGDQSTVDQAMIIAEATNLTRTLVNEPANYIYPETFADRCLELSALGVEVEVWDKQKLEREKCGALLAVAQASEREPRLVVMKYQGASSGDQRIPLALVGKGVTFDSGGLSIKPSEHMFDMKMDMAGAATVLGAMHAIARLKLPVNVIGLVGLVENMISGRAYRLGDVLTARSGKTIEVHNTDAEGRVVLADVLDVALSYKPDRIIDLATLTGACMIALGRNVAGAMSNNSAWCEQVLRAAEAVGEQAWQLPMFSDFNQAIKSNVADIKNVGDGRYGGAITAAKFLEEFVGETPWVHLDIAGPAFAERASAWMDAGASGCFVRTLVHVAKNLAN